MVVPLLNMRFRSAIWYQGESNAGQYKEYMVFIVDHNLIVAVQIPCHDF